MDLPLNIRFVKIQEVSRVKSITKRAYQCPYQDGGLVTKPCEPDDLVEMLEQGTLFILVAEYNGEIIGAVRYKITANNEIYFEKLVTLEQYRNKNVGSSLMHRLEEIARKNKHPRILLDCAKEKGLPAYYQGYGYKINSIKKHHDHHDVFMSKSIKF